MLKVNLDQIKKRELATAKLRRRLEAAIEDDPGVVELLNRVVSRELDPASAAAQLLEGEIDE